jgi:DNA phosphorothioation-dependent restriction protein DptG
VGIDYTWDMLTLNFNKFKTFMLTTRSVQSGETRSYLRFHRFVDQWFRETVAFDGVAQKLLVGKHQQEMMIASKSSGAGHSSLTSPFTKILSTGTSVPGRLI